VKGLMKYLVLAVFAGAVALPGCGKKEEGTLESLGKKADKAASEASKKADEAAQKAADAAKKAQKDLEKK